MICEWQEEEDTSQHFPSDQKPFGLMFNPALALNTDPNRQLSTCVVILFRLWSVVGPFWGYFGIQRRQDAPRWTEGEIQEGSQDAFKSFKILKSRVPNIDLILFKFVG